MMANWLVWGVLAVVCTIHPSSGSTEDNPPEYMSREDRESLKEEARDMFYHAYNAYMDNAYPADELMPLSCKGRYRGSEPDRGDIDSTLGNFSLTLVDTLDTLVVLGDLEEFENAVRLIVEDLTFDTDVIVSLFETNIRMLGGLLSAHILAEYLQLRADIMPWYRGELLDRAKDLGYRFLPAFNTTTGIPFGRINLRHGMKGVPAEMCRETCTACAGSMILEMAALSRLTGESIFEEKAQKAMDALWKMRHRGTDLMGSVLNVHSGDWVRRDSGVGAGIDSYYEYCLKAYILLGDEKYLGRFNKHYDAVMKYVSQGPMLLDVHMHRPNTNSKNFMDALLAFWPGLQVLKGDIKPAVETHEMLYQVMQRHNFIPEAFTTDFQVHWGHHPLRPEFLESTYFLYRATGDHYYLGVGRKVLKSLQTYARVTCGYAAVSDVRTNKHDDTMDSFVLSETFKYLYLLFAEPNDLVLDLDEFIFTTEGHLLPLTLAAVRTNVTADVDRDVVEVDDLDRTCPNSLHLFPASVRQPLRNMVEDVCPRRTLKRRLNASQFQANNLDHLKILSNMGITILTLADGRVQLLHTFSNARTAQDAEEGLIFMQEIVELSKKQSQQSETRPQIVKYVRSDVNPPQEVTLLAGPANFGPRFEDGKTVTGEVELVVPAEACDDLVEPEKLVGKIALVTRGNCMFVEKARRIQKAGAIAGIVLDTVAGSSASTSPMFAMSGDDKDADDVIVPVVFLFTKEAAELVFHMATAGILTVTLGDFPRDEAQLKAPSDQSVFERVKGSLKDLFMRQVTSQNSAIKTRPVGVTDATEPDDDAKETIIVDYGNLKASMYKDATSVKIEKTGLAPAPKTLFFTQTSNSFEKMWHSIKLDILRMIYSNDKPTLLVPMAKVQFLYTMVHTTRGLKTAAPIKIHRLRTMLKWLLEELNEIQHDTKLTNENDFVNFPFPKLSSLTKIHDDEELHDLIDLRPIVRAIKIRHRTIFMEENAIPQRPIDDTSNIAADVASTMEKLNELTYTMTGSLFERVDRRFHLNIILFKFAILFDNEKISRIEEKIAKDNEDNENFVVLKHDRLKALVFEKKRIVKFGVISGNNVATSSKPRVTNHERLWYNARQFHLAAMFSHPESYVEINIGALWMKSKLIKLLRDTTNNPHETVEDMVMWYLRQLSEVEIDPVLIEDFAFLRFCQQARLKDSANSRSIVEEWDEEIKAIAEKFSIVFDHSKSDIRRLIAKNRGKMENEKEFVANEEKSVITNDETDDDNEIANVLRNKIIRALNIENKRENDGIKSDKDVLMSKEKTMDDMETKITKDREDVVKTNSASIETTSNEFDHVLKIKNTDEIKFDDVKKIRSASDDPLEEFKNPVWASEEAKETKKSFSRFDGKTDSSAKRYDATNSKKIEYPSEYSTKNDETRNKLNEKRIDDEL